MGDWGHKPFDNDSACDWASDLEEVDDLTHIEFTIDNALDDEEPFLDAGAGCEVIAACETLARLLGKPGPSDQYTKDVEAWVAEHPVKPTPALLKRADKALERVLSADSELRQCWDEVGPQEWLAVVKDLRQRLRP